MAYKVLDLFSGIGGFSLGLERAGMETIAFCEIEDFPRKVLNKHWPEIPIASDVKKLNYKDGVLYDDTREIYRGAVELICGGYPCQPFSTAGQRRGEEDDRHLWPEMHRLIKSIKPRWVIAENVAGHISMGLDEVLSDLEAENYTVWTFVIPACALDGYHRRDRLWIVANANNARDTAQGFRANENRQTQKQNGREFSQPESCGHCELLADTKSRERCGNEINRRHGCAETQRIFRNRDGLHRECSRGQVEPKLGRAFDGFSSWLDGFEYIGNPDDSGEPRVTNECLDRAKRLKGLGNAVVPQIPEIIGRAILQADNDL